MTWGKGSRGQGSDDRGGGAKPETCNGSPSCTENTHRSSSAVLGFLTLASSAHLGPQTPLAAGRMGLEGPLPGLSVCLPASSPRLQRLGKEGRGGGVGGQKILPRHSTPRSLLFMPRSLPTRVLSLFRAVQLAASLAGLSHPRVRSVNQAVR